jgi:tyrosine-protein kinase Etk/Wzc
MAVLYALVAKPVYEANLMIHVEEESPNASKNILSEASSLFETKKAAIAEMELLRSRMVVSQAVDNLQLYIEVQPKYFPWSASGSPTRTTGAVEPGLFGYGGYVWGGEKAEVSVFDVPESWLNLEFTLTALRHQPLPLFRRRPAPRVRRHVGQRYRVPTPDGTMESRSTACMPIRARASPQAQVAPGHHPGHPDGNGHHRAGQAVGCDRGQAAGRECEAHQRLLSEIGREYMRQNLARKTEEAEKSLAFLNKQLPILKRQLEQSEDRYNQFRNTHGTVDLREEARMSLAQATAARARRIELLQKKTELLARFTEDHPIVAAINRQRKEVDAEIDEVSAAHQDLAGARTGRGALTRDIKVNTDLYTALSNTAQQLRLISVGRVSNVRMVDAPIAPEKPLKPNRPLIVALARSPGCSSARWCVRAQGHGGGIDDPQKIERLLGCARRVRDHPAQQQPGQADAQGRGEAASCPAGPDHARRCRRRKPAQLPRRAAIRDAALQEQHRDVRRTHARLGKSFVSANFAAVMAASGKRVLLIDADLRNGQLHRYFGVGRERGLSRAIIGQSMRSRSIIHHDVLENLDFIPTGELPPNRSEFLLHLNFGACSNR